MSDRQSANGHQNLTHQYTAHQYTSHNFEAMNRAIDNQVQKQELLSGIYRDQRSESATRTLLFAVSSICLVLLTGTLLWWLLLGPGKHLVSPVLVSKPLTVSDEVTLENTKSLATLSAQETPSGAEAGFIDTSFTVFHRNLTEAGDYVVTGKTYAPGQLNLPYEQYCYLESASENGELAAQPLAAYEGRDYKLETEQEIFVRLAAQYCRFTAPETP